MHPERIDLTTKNLSEQPTNQLYGRHVCNCMPEYKVVDTCIYACEGLCVYVCVCLRLRVCLCFCVCVTETLLPMK